MEERLVLKVRKEDSPQNRAKFHLKSYVELFLLISKNSLRSRCISYWSCMSQSHVLRAMLVFKRVHSQKQNHTVTIVIIIKHPFLN